MCYILSLDVNTIWVDSGIDVMKIWEQANSYK